MSSSRVSSNQILPMVATLVGDLAGDGNGGFVGQIALSAGF